MNKQNTSHWKFIPYRFQLKNIAVIFGFLTIYSFYSAANVVAKDIDITVYKSPTCGCCNKWIKHLEKEGFNVTAINKRDMHKIKQKFDVKREYQSCHTGKVGRYFIEGHVPAGDIKKLLAEKPYAKGLAVPGMPMGSPGMEGHRKDDYSVILINKQDKASVYANH